MERKPPTLTFVAGGYMETTALEDSLAFSLKKERNMFYPNEFQTLHIGMYSSFIHDCQTWEPPGC